MSLFKGIVLPALLFSSFAALAEPRLVERGQEAGFDITSTPRGHRVAAATAAAWAEEHDVHRSADSLRVYDFGSAREPHLVILPEELEFRSASIATNAGGEIEVAVEYDLDASRLPHDRLPPHRLIPGPDERFRPVAQQTTSWRWWTNGCLATTNNTYGVMNSCYNLYKGTPEYDGSRDFWHLEYWGTAKSKGIYAMTSASVEAASSSLGPTQTLGGFEPREDTVRNCVSVDVGVEAFGYAGNFTHTQCEMWDIDQPLSTSMPRFKNNWRVSVGKYGTDRTVAMGMATSVPQGGFPRYTLRHAFAVSV